MMYQFTARVIRKNEETYELVVEADTPEKALDLAEATLETYPQGRSSAVRYCLRTNVDNFDVEIVDVEPTPTEGT